MTIEYVLLIVILGTAIVLFVTEVIRADLVGLGVLCALALTGLVDADQALAGFSNPAVVTVWAMFILSAGLARTGVSRAVGEQVLRYVRGSDGQMIAVLMTVTAILSAFMNNIGVAAMFLPITQEIARRTGRSPSMLLLPMAYGSLLGGLVLLIGTASNLVVRDAMREAGLEPMGLFDLTPGGIVILAVSVAYMALIGRRFLPVRQPIVPLTADDEGAFGVPATYELRERLANIVLPEDSPLTGMTLAESRIGRALGLHVLSLRRATGQQQAAEPDVVLQRGDRLLALGRLDRIAALTERPPIEILREVSATARLVDSGYGLAECQVTDGSDLAGLTVAKAAFRRRHGLNALAITRGGETLRHDLRQVEIQEGDVLLLHGAVSKLDEFTTLHACHQIDFAKVADLDLEDHTRVARIPRGSALEGSTLEESRLGAAYSLSVLAIDSGEGTWNLPSAETRLQAGDMLLLDGRPQDLQTMAGHGGLRVDSEVAFRPEDLSSGPLQVIEVMLSPSTSLAGETLASLRFRDRYGVSVLAIWRGTRAHRSGLGDIPLQFGDALLCYGPRAKFELLARDSDFVVLEDALQEPLRLAKAPLAGVIMLGVIASVLWLGMPISIAGITGAVLMIGTKCLTMDEAYEGIDWKAVFLIAAMLPLGTAMIQSGAADDVAAIVLRTVGDYGPRAVLSSLMVGTMFITQFMPSAVVAVIMSPVALSAALDQGISPYPYIFAIAYALAASFLSPVAHPANVLVMTPGGYRFTDYIFQGLPIAVIVVVISVVILPLIYPF